MAPPSCPDRPPETVAAILRALADRRRYAILAELAAADGPVACCALSQHGQVSPSTLSHHLQMLERAGLIDVAHEGRYAMLRFRRARYEEFLRRLAQDAGSEPSPAGTA